MYNGAVTPIIIYNQKKELKKMGKSIELGKAYIDQKVEDIRRRQGYVLY